LRIENDEMRARLADLEAHVQAMGNARAHTPIVSEEERADSLTDDSLNDPDSSNDSLKDAVTALVRSQQAMMERMD